MTWRCPDAVEEALWAAAAAQLPAAARERPTLVRAIEERSRRYTSARADLAEPLVGGAAAADLAARALFFTVADAAKVMVPLSELAGRGQLPPADPTRPLRLLDLGAGAGAMTLGCLAFFTGRPLAVHAVDREPGALALLADAVARLGGPITLTTEVADLSRFAGPAGWDLITAGSVLNELAEPQRRPLVARALAALDPAGSLVLIEPALRETARALHELRDAILAAGEAHVFAPCTRSGAPCPALADPRDWCHEDRPAALPPRAAQLAAATGLRDGGLKFSYLVLRRAAAPLVEAVAGRRALRVVSQPHRPKGFIECYACGEAGRGVVRLLRRHRSAANRPFERAARGDVLRLGPADDLGPADEVELVRPATCSE